jgi:hypothetical protein
MGHQRVRLLAGDPPWLVGCFGRKGLPGNQATIRALGWRHPLSGGIEKGSQGRFTWSSSVNSNNRDNAWNFNGNNGNVNNNNRNNTNGVRCVARPARGAADCGEDGHGLSGW